MLALLCSYLSSSLYLSFDYGIEPEASGKHGVWGLLDMVSPPCLLAHRRGRQSSKVVRATSGSLVPCLHPENPGVWPATSLDLRMDP